MGPSGDRVVRGGDRARVRPSRARRPTPRCSPTGSARLRAEHRGPGRPHPGDRLPRLDPRHGRRRRRPAHRAAGYRAGPPLVRDGPPDPRRPARAPRLPAGLELRPVEPEHWRPIWEADVEAFSDDWDPRRPERDRLPALPGRARPGARAVAGRLGRRPGRRPRAGDDQPRHRTRASGGGEGVLDSVAVRGPWRRRGLARALIVRALVALRDHGETSAALGVDVDNPNQALTLYESCGFVVEISGTVYERPFAGHSPARPSLISAAPLRRRGGPRERRGPATAARARWSSSAPWPGRTRSEGSRRGEAGERLDHRRLGAAGEVGPAPGAGEERVAADEQARPAIEQADRALGVARRVQDLEVDGAEGDAPAFRQLDGRHAGHDGERRVERLRVLQAVAVEGVDGDRRAGRRGDRGVVADVVPVAMGRDDELERPAARGQPLGDPGRARAWRCRWRSPRGWPRRPGPRRWWRRARPPDAGAPSIRPTRWDRAWASAPQPAWG